MTAMSLGQNSVLRLDVDRMALIELLEDTYRAFGWDVEGAPPRRGPGEIISREIDELADALIDKIKSGSLIRGRTDE